VNRLSKECFGSDKVKGDLMGEIPKPHLDCVDCPINTECYYEYGKADKKGEVSRLIKKHGTLRTDIR